MLMNGRKKLSLPENGENRVKDISCPKSSTLGTNVGTQMIAKLNSEDFFSGAFFIFTLVNELN